LVALPTTRLAPELNAAPISGGDRRELSRPQALYLIDSEYETALPLDKWVALERSSCYEFSQDDYGVGPRFDPALLRQAFGLFPSGVTAFLRDDRGRARRA